MASLQLLLLPLSLKVSGYDLIFLYLEWLGNYFTIFCVRNTDLLQGPHKTLDEVCVLAHSGTNSSSEIHSLNAFSA